MERRYEVVFESEIDMEFDDSEAYLEVGDILIQRDIQHARVNRGTKRRSTSRPRYARCTRASG
jgi:hypothetical protein